MQFPKALCNRTITIYRPRGGTVDRYVTKGFYHYMDVWLTERFRREFLLVLPEELQLQAGDRIYDGIGPEVVQWDSFLPVRYPGLSQIGKVKAYCHQGTFYYMEASH